MLKFILDYIEEYHGLVSDEFKSCNNPNSTNSMAAVLATLVCCASYFNSTPLSYFNDAISDFADSYLGLYSKDECAQIKDLTQDHIHNIACGISEKEENESPISRIVKTLYEITETPYDAREAVSITQRLKEFYDIIRPSLADLRRLKESKPSPTVTISEESYKIEKSVSNEFRAGYHYFRFLCNGLMLAASTMFALFSQQMMKEPFQIKLFVLRFVLMYLGLWLIRGVFRAILGKEAEKNNLNPLWYLAFVLLPVVYVLCKGFLG